MDNLLVVISGPSGGGKSTIVNKLLSRNASDYKRVSTYTTRKVRSNEKENEQYRFISQQEYDKLNASGKLMAQSVVDGYSYRSSNNRYASS